MNSRERILATLDHKEPDRLAIDFGGTDATSIHVAAYERLAKSLGYDLGHPLLVLPEASIVEVDERVRDRFSCDTAPLQFYPEKWREWLAPDGLIYMVPEKWRPEQLPNGDYVLRDAAGIIRAQRPLTSAYFDAVNPPLADINGPDDLEKYSSFFDHWNWPAEFDESVVAYGARARAMHAGSDRAVLALWRMHFLFASLSLRGFEQCFLDMLIDEGLARAILDKLLETYKIRARRFLAEMKDSVDVIFLSDDLGTQEGPMIDPKLFRRIIKPYYADLYAFLKRESGGKKLLLHSCGAVRDFIPDLIEIGLDALNPVQISAKGMDSAALKRDFGKDITFWGGGCDTQEILARATPAQVRDHVKRQIDIFAPGGGFVFSQVHNITADVPAENIIAMYDTAREYGGA